RLWIERHDFVCVFAVDVDQAVSDHGLFAVALSLHRTDYFAAIGVDGTDVVRSMIVREHPLRPRIVVDSVRSLAYINLLYKLQCRGIEHRDFILAAVAREPMFELR